MGGYSVFLGAGIYIIKLLFVFLLLTCFVLQRGLSHEPGTVENILFPPPHGPCLRDNLKYSWESEVYTQNVNST